MFFLYNSELLLMLGLAPTSVIQLKSVRAESDSYSDENRLAMSRLRST